MEDPPSEISSIIHTLTQAPPSRQRAAIQKYFTPTSSFTHPFCATGSWSLSFPFPIQLPSNTDHNLTVDSRWATTQIYQWYKILSPDIELSVQSVTWNEGSGQLFVDLRQKFKLWFVPGYVADVRLVTVLGLVRAEGDGQSKREIGNGGSSVTGDGNRTGHVKTAEKPFSYAALASGEPTMLAQDNEKKQLWYISSQNDLYQTNEWIKFLVPWGIGVTLMWAWQLWASFLCVAGAIVLFPQTWFKERSWADLPPRKI